MDFTVTDIDALKAALIVSIHAAGEIAGDGGTFYPNINGASVPFDEDLQDRVSALLDAVLEATHGA